jgi:hypothetical protein
MEIPKEELPEWATSGVRSNPPPIKGSEEETIWRLKYGSGQSWWAYLQKMALEGKK